MSTEPFEYTVPYEPDIQAALDKLRQHAFRALGVEGSIDPEKLLEADSEEDIPPIGYINQISDSPKLYCASRLTDDELDEYFETLTPTLDHLQMSREFWEDIDRGTARYVVLYEGNLPQRICFAGYI